MSSETDLDDLELDQAVGQHPGGPGGPSLGDRAARRGDDDRLGLAVEQRLGAGPGLVVEGGVEAAGGEPAADVGHGAERTPSPSAISSSVSPASVRSRSLQTRFIVFGGASGGTSSRPRRDQGRPR